MYIYTSYIYICIYIKNVFPNYHIYMKNVYVCVTDHFAVHQ